MKKSIHFFNWSLKKLLSSETDSFKRAKINILFVILLFSIIKATVATSVAWYHDQFFQFGRAIIFTIFYIVLIKILLINKNYAIIISKVMIILGLFIIWSNLFIYAQAVNIITLQFVFMLILSSFYLLGIRRGIIYSFFACVPIMVLMVIGFDLAPANVAPELLASPGYEIIVFLNFVTIITAHYLFHNAFVNNVKEKEMLNAQLQMAVKEANQAAKSKTDFLSTMSHELRTPLNSVIGMTDLFLDDPNSSDKIENLKVLKFSAVSLHAVINDILDFNKLGINMVNLESIPFHLHELLEDVCAGLNYQADEKGVKLILNIDEEIKNQVIISDPTRITQIIYNLVGNAIKFTSKGGVTVQLKLAQITSEEINIKFLIADTGIGISKDKQEAIFEPFHQASSNITRDFGGTGLGLAIVKQLLQLFHSKINLESKEGEGSTFFFNINFKLGKEVSKINLEDEERQQDISKLKILVAEDNPMNRLLLRKVLSKWNNHPVFTENGQEAYEKASTEVFDVILMDLHMPVMDGYTASQYIRQLPNSQNPNIPIIAFTASVSPDLNDKIKEVGIDDYIYKPFNPKDLFRKLSMIALTKASSN